MVSAGCGDSGSPDRAVPLGDLDLAIAVPAAFGVGDTVTARLVVLDRDQDALETCTVGWRWPGPRGGSHRRAAGTAVVLQIPQLGPQTITAHVTQGDSSATVTAAVTVVGGEADHSTSMVFIPAGPFLRGDRPGTTAFASFTPQRTITLAAFTIGRTEVTNQAYAAAFNRAMEHHLIVRGPDPYSVFYYPDGGPDRVRVLDLRLTDLLWNADGLTVPLGRERYPATGMTWAGAAAACNWMSELDGLEPAYRFVPSDPLHVFEAVCDVEASGYRLPTEAQWEKAARGGLTLPSGANPLPERTWPWGEDPAHLEIFAGAAGLPAVNASIRFNGWEPGRGGEAVVPLFGGTLPVGSFPQGRSPYGLDDLAGNVAEWCQDWFSAFYYSQSPDTDPTGPASVSSGVDDFKVLRGDGWEGPWWPVMGAYVTEAGCAKRRAAGYHHAARDLGFRVARTAGG